MVLQIKSDQIKKNEITGEYTVYYYIVDDTEPDKRLIESKPIQGSTQLEIYNQLRAKYEAFKSKYDQQQTWADLADSIAQQVMDDVDGGGS